MVNDVERQCTKFRTNARDVTLRLQIPERDYVGELYDELWMAIHEVIKELTREVMVVGFPICIFTITITIWRRQDCTNKQIIIQSSKP
jgi:hypothetical protein